MFSDYTSRHYPNLLCFNWLQFSCHQRLRRLAFDVVLVTWLFVVVGLAHVALVLVKAGLEVIGRILFAWGGLTCYQWRWCDKIKESVLCGWLVACQFVRIGWGDNFWCWGILPGISGNQKKFMSKEILWTSLEFVTSRDVL